MTEYDLAIEEVRQLRLQFCPEDSRPICIAIGDVIRCLKQDSADLRQLQVEIVQNSAETQATLLGTISRIRQESELLEQENERLCGLVEEYQIASQHENDTCVACEDNYKSAIKIMNDNFNKLNSLYSQAVVDTKQQTAREILQILDKMRLYEAMEAVIDKFGLEE